MAEVPLPTPTQASVPSTDIRNTVFAGAKLDEEVTGSGEYYTDRLGVNRLTNSGRNNQFNSAQVERANRFEQFLLSSGYVFLGDYEDGPFQISARNQYIRYDHQYYRLNAETDVGYTTTGTDATSFANDVMHFVLMDGDTLRQDMSSHAPGLGASLSGLEGDGTVQDAIFFMTPKIAAADPAVGVSDVYAKFGTVMNAAISKAQKQGCGLIFVPGGRYTLDVTIAATLSRSLTIMFSADAYIQVNTPIDAFNININGNHLNIVANGARIMSNWGGADGTNVAAFRLKDATLDKSLSVTDLKVGMADTTSKFGYTVYGSALNLPTFHRCLLQGNVGIYLESALLNGASAHAMGPQIMFCEIYATKYCVDIANQGLLGCEGIIISGGEFISSGTAIRINNTGLSSSSYLPPKCHITYMHINAYQGLYAKDIQDLFVMGVEFQSKHNATTVVNGILELGGVQKLHHHNNTYTSVAYSGGTNANKAPAIYQFASTLTNAYFKSSGNIFQLDGMTNPPFAFEGTSNISTVESSDDRLQALSTWTTAEFNGYVRLPGHTAIGDVGAAAGLDYSSAGAFSSGVLALGRRPAQGFVYNIGTSILPSASTVTQITFPSEMVGKEVTILLAAAAVNFTHGVNMVCPDQKSIKMNLPNVVKVFAINTTQCRIIDVGGITSNHTDITAPPSSTTSSGYVGAEYYDSNTGNWWKYFVTSDFVGWRYIKTFAVGS
ncbi:TPA: hypothetical protein OTT14_003050 [Klebsiella michiganensis]|nr:hypothetical protein [Klebsiella michiganensis]